MSGPIEGWGQGQAPAPRAASDGWSLPVLVLGLAGAALFAWAGLNMVTLRSVGGNTVAEAFDQLMGYFSLGMACLCLIATSVAARRAG